MKRRLIAGLLCLAMVLTLLPILPTYAYGDEEFSITSNGEVVTSVSVNKYEQKDDKVTLSANGLEADVYQWQIRVTDELWVDINGASGKTIDLSYAMIASLLDASGTAAVRCVGTAEGETATTKAVTVTVDASAPVAMVAASNRTSAVLSGTQTDEQSDDDTQTTYSVVIHYVFEDGEIAAESYTAELAAGSNFSATVTFPTVQGYLPYVAEKQQDSIELNYTEIDQDDTITVVYKPTNVDYTVIHYRQNLKDDNYTEFVRETKQGLTNSQVPEVAKNDEGFYALLYEKPAIAADGSTVVEVYYDRYYYLMNFGLDGGYGVEPIYARYGAFIGDVGTPTKAGYDFSSWSLNGKIEELPSTMPAENRTYKAVWAVHKTAKVTVVFWGENADDKEYSYIRSFQEDPTPGKSYSFDASQVTCPFLEHSHTGCTLICSKNHTHTDECYDCGSVAHTHDSDCSQKWKSAGSDTVTVAADGSSVVNVYFDRTTFSVKFYNRGGTSEYKNHRITAKWGQYICDKWPTQDGSSSWFVSADTGDWTTQASIQVMPVGGAKFYGPRTGKNALTASYYVEIVPGETGNAGTETKNGITYKLHHKDTLLTNGDGSGINITVEDLYDIPGFTYKEGTAIGSPYNGAKLYYTRNSYKLTFNDGYHDVKTELVKYEASLGTYSGFVPAVPEAYAPNSVTFGGWYLNPECTGAEYVLNEHTMPADNVLLYAKWVPVTHTVEFYLDRDALDAGTKLSTHPDITVPHGSKVEPTPEDPENGSYTFVGWFYMDGGEEKAFDFGNMPVNKDLRVYGKWSSNVLKQYFIYYKDNDTEIDIADPTTGSGLAGVTKTFDAKGGTELYAPYQEGYFPVTKSHSLTLDIENDDNNRFTFYYVQKEAVPYTVKYLNKETGEPVATEKTVADNRKAVVTETFVPVSSMMPDAYQKRLVVSAEEGAVNEIIFYYVEDTEHAYYKITHYTENLATDSQGNTTWTEYASSEAVGDIGTIYTAEPLTISGFTYDSTVEGTVASGKLTASGLELKLYYTRNSYPYQVRYLEEGTGKQLADPKNGTGKYGQMISESAIDIPNYNAVDPTSQTLNIQIEESTEVKRNIITFYYREQDVTIHYQVVGPDGCGTVTPTAETLKVLTGTAQGSTADVTSDDYRFVGWYKDQACTQPVTASDGTVQNGKFTPAKVDGKNVAATYYAKFEENYTTLTISKSVADGKTYDQEDVFIFDVTGPDGISFSITLRAGDSKTITKVKVGAEYTVTERTGWSSRYTVQGSSTQTKVLTAKASDNEFAFTNNLNQNKWLTASDTVTNTFKPVGE